MNSHSAYHRLAHHFRRLSALEGANAILGWDQQTVMPPGAADARAEQVAALEATVHELITRSELSDWLAEADADTSLDDWQRANLREMRRQWRRATALDESLVTALAHARGRCHAIWSTARPANDFAALVPALDEVVRLTRESARRFAELDGISPYDALIDAFEPGFTAAAIDAAFAPLRTELPGLVDDVLARQLADGPSPTPAGPFPVEAQRDVGMQFMRALGFDFHHGRLDVSAHPFCGGVPSDIRITTRYRDDDFAGAFMGVLHETGHALYEHQLPALWRGQPVGRARSMGIHESQSLFVEMQLCRSDAFYAWAAPLLRDAFGRQDDPAFTADALRRAGQRVDRGFIRVDADEVTYPLHVFLRFELEKAIIAGDLAVADLPAAWNEGFEALFGMRPPTDALGCMQDIHWIEGAFGYFPSYTLGAMLAAQLREAMEADGLAIDDLVGAGSFAPIVASLGERIHAKASLLETQELVRAATGSDLSGNALLRHIRRRYLAA